MKILVTGGAGYIGSVVVEQLIAAGESVVVFDNLSQGHKAAVHPAADFVQGDLLNRALLDSAFIQYRPDAVMHFASRTLVGESMEKPFLYLGDNVRTGLNLLECMVEHEVKQVILSSTANLFDQPERMPIGESERIVPGSPYGESKFILERMLYWMDRIYGVRFACLRYFNAAGATETRGEDHDPELHLIPIVLAVALGKREKVTIFGEDYSTRDGTCVRDYIHVIDLAQAHILALRALERGSRCYNLGNGEGFTVKEVIDTAREVTGTAIRAEVGPRRAGDPAVLVAASDTIRKELGWTPQWPHVRDIIQSAWQWHKANPDGYLN
ncbi:MAG: UDP-glucose 4-epimerase GalE [Acidobacteria bacterium]|nr:MAG: UDP-glucose 4-epimerase GalE [Acidobacteriota bacterium]